MTEVSREEFDALVARVTKLEGTPPIDPVSRLSVIATPGIGWVRLGWSPPLTKKVVKFEAGRSGQDVTGHGPWKGVYVASARTATFDKLMPEVPYDFTVTAIYSDGSTESKTVMSTPLAPPAPVPGETTGRGALSGLPFNLTIFNGGDSSESAMLKLGSVVGVPAFDGILTFMTRGSGWGAARDNTLAAKAKAVLDAGGIVIWSLPHSMDGDANMNIIGAKNGYAIQQQGLAEWMVSKGLNHHNFYLRPDWEANGSWYHWTIHGPAGVSGLRESLWWMKENFDLAGLDQPGWIMCLNISDGGSECTWKDLDKGNTVFDIYTIDQYDAWPGVRTRAIWEQKMQSPQSLRNCIAQAKAAGKLAGVDECGPWHTSDGAYDNPAYWDFMVGEIMSNVEHFSHLSIFNSTGAPSHLFHDFGHNPYSYAHLKELLSSLRSK